MQDIEADKRVISISSGAARYGSYDWHAPVFIAHCFFYFSSPYPSWSQYCSSKAGLDMLMRVLNAEQQKKAHPVLAISVAPGIIATSMQEQIRATPAEHFEMKDYFVELHEQGKLWSAEHAVRMLYEHVIEAHASTFEENVVVDIRKLIDDQEGGQAQAKKKKTK